MNEQYIDKIERYLAGEMSAEEQSAFQHDLQNDAALAEIWAIYQTHEAQLNKLAKQEDTAAFANLLAEVGAPYEDETEEAAIAKQAPVRALNRRTWYSIAAVAALLLVLFGIQFLVIQPQQNDLYAKYANYDALHVTTRSANNDSLLELGATAFNAKNYNKAETALAAYLQHEPKDDEIRLAFAATLIENKKFELAHTTLQSISKQASAFQSKALYYEALCFLKEGNSESCIALLKQIKTGEQSFEQAQTMLNEMTKN